MTDTSKSTTKTAEAKQEARKEPTAAEQKANEKAVEQAREESAKRAAAAAAPSAEAAIPVDEGGITQPEVPPHATVDDAAGVERIVTPEYSDGWQPAPSKADESQIAAAKERNKRLEAQRKERLDLLKKQSS